MKKQIFGERLRELRKMAQLTQDELAQKTGLSRSAISMYEVGRREPDFEQADDLAEFFDVSLLYLLGNTDRITPYQDGRQEQRADAYATALLMPKETLTELEEVRLIRAYRKAKPDLQAAVRAVLGIKA